MPYAMIPDDALQRLPQMNGAAAKVLIAVASYRNGCGECWPSLTAMAAKTGLDRVTVCRAINRLVSLGVVRRIGRKGRVTIYALGEITSGASATGDSGASATSRVRTVAPAPTTSGASATPLVAPAPHQQYQEQDQEQQQPAAAANAPRNGELHDALRAAGISGAPLAELAAAERLTPESVQAADRRIRGKGGGTGLLVTELRAEAAREPPPPDRPFVGSWNRNPLGVDSDLEGARIEIAARKARIAAGQGSGAACGTTTRTGGGN